MKTIIKYILAFSIIASITSACTKTDEKYFFKCKIDGVEFVANDVTSSYDDLDGAHINGYKNKGLNDTTSTSISIYATGILLAKASNYPLLTPYDATFIDEKKVTWTLKSGSFTITEFNTLTGKTKGNFKTIIFENGAGATKTATDGTFYVHLNK